MATVIQAYYQRGIALLEVLLAIIAISVSLIGTYYLYNYVTIQQKNSQTSNQIISMASVYADLYASHLTGNVTNKSELLSTFYASNRMPEKFFSVTGSTVSQMNGYYGVLDFKSVSSHGFTVIVPVSDNSDGAKNQICTAIKDYVRSCNNNDDASVTVAIDVGDS